MFNLRLTKWNWKPWLKIELEAGTYRWSWLRWGRWQLHFVRGGACYHFYIPYSYTNTEKKAFCRNCHNPKLEKYDFNKPVKGVFLNET